MIGGIVEISENDRHLSLHRGFLKVTEGDQELGRVPLDDVTALVLSARQVSLSKNVMSALLSRKAIIVTTGANWHPQGLMLPLDGHHGMAGILADQISLSAPRRKRLWQAIVREKITNQRTILSWHGADGGKVAELATLAKRVRSGDPQNIEAQAARHYWPALMGPAFRRDVGAPGINGKLNYGYAILRAAMARAVVAAGLNPALGLHHKSRVNSFALVDDLMEPFRPLVDDIVCQLPTDDDDLTPETKRMLAAVLQRDLMGDRGLSPLINCLQRLAQSLVSCLNDKSASLAFSALPEDDSLFRGAGP